MTSAPAGVWIDPAAPIAAMTPSRITTVWPSRAGAPVPSMIRALRSTTTAVSTVTNALTGPDSWGR